MHILSLPDEALLSILQHLVDSTKTCECNNFSNPLTAIAATCTTFARLVRSVFAGDPDNIVDLIHPSSLDNEPLSFHPPTPSLASKLEYFHHFIPPSLRILRLSPTTPGRTVRRILQKISCFCESLLEVAFHDAGAIDVTTASKLSCCTLHKLSVSDARDPILSAIAQGFSILAVLVLTRFRVNYLSQLQVCLSARALLVSDFRFGVCVLYVSIDFGKRPRATSAEAHKVMLNAPARFVRHVANRAEHELCAMRRLSITSVSWGSVEGRSMLSAHYASYADDDSTTLHNLKRSRLLVEVQTSPSELDIVDRTSAPAVVSNEHYREERSVFVPPECHLSSRRDFASIVRAITTDGEAGATRKLRDATVLYDHGRLRTLHDAFSDTPGGGSAQQAALRNALYNTSPSLSRLDARLSPASPSVSMTLIRNLTYVIRFTKYLRTVSFPSDWLWSVDSPSFRHNLEQWTGIRHIILTPPVRCIVRSKAHIAECLLPQGRLLHFLNIVAKACPKLSCVYIERAPWQPMKAEDDQSFEARLQKCGDKLECFANMYSAINIDSIRMQVANKQKIEVPDNSWSDPHRFSFLSHGMRTT